jgi:hypothetical protein
MTMDDKIERVKQIMDAVGKLPIGLDLSEAERYVLGQWIAKMVGTAYETGLSDGERQT